MKALALLGEMGCSFVGWKAASRSETKTIDNSYPGNTGALRLPAPGWYSWAEIATLLGDLRILEVVPGARLTAEARDRLARLGVTIREV
jgi:hypothetical protein